MNSTQEGIMWIGLMVVLVYLFTDAKFRDMIFNRGSEKTTVSAPYSLTSIITLASNSGLPATSNSTAPSGATLV
jgi:hypothetical protein